MHRGVGNILTADGSVYALNSLHLRDLLAGATNPTTTDELRLAIPRLPGE
jgi:prepilin-type processing-associated H-X9-DG protein